MKIDDKWYGENFAWYVKWGATVFIIASVMFRGAGPEWRQFDLLTGSIGTTLWLWVSVMWKDRSLIILNSVMLVMLGSTFLKEL